MLTDFPTLSLLADVTPCRSTQAADVDLSSVRETAVMGLQRLEALDQGFSAFQVDGTKFA